MARRALDTKGTAKAAATRSNVLTAAAAQQTVRAPIAPVRPAKSPRAPKLEGLSAEQQVAALLRDRQTLAAHLAKAEARVSALEARHSELADRITWALDTLDDLLKNRS
jgi:hypothetical protein